MDDYERPDWLTIREAAEHLRVSHDTVERWLIPYALKGESGKLRFVRMGSATRRIRVLAADVYHMLPRAPRIRPSPGTLEIVPPETPSGDSAA